MNWNNIPFYGRIFLIYRGDIMKICAICGEDAGFDRRVIANKEIICPNCLKKSELTPRQLFRMKRLTVEEVKQGIKDRVNRMNHNGEEILNFKATRKIGLIMQFDDTNKKILIPGEFGVFHLLNYKDIISFELLEDNEIVSSGGVGRALVGGVLFGGAGAVVGAVTNKKTKQYCTNLKIKLSINNVEKPALYISFINKKTKVGSSTYVAAYNEAQECISTLQIICDNNSKGEEKNPTCVVDEIKRFKKLWDEGIITHEEFDKKKKELLDS